MCGIFVGVLGGFFVFKALRCARRGGCHGRHRCGHGGGHGHWRHHGHGGYRGHRLWRVWRALDLDRAQRDAVFELAEEVAARGTAARVSGLRFADDLAGAVAAESFDRAALEHALIRPRDALESAATALVDGAQRLHAVLTPAQRERLRHELGLRGSGPPTPDGATPGEGGPYR